MKNAAICMLIIFVIGLSACDNYFSESWGSPRDYDIDNIDVNINNVDEWVERSIGNPDLAEVLVEKITKELIHATNSWDRAVLLEGGVKLAVENSGFGASIITYAADLLGELESGSDIETVQDMFRKMQNDFNSGRGPNAADSLAAMALRCIQIDADGVPRFEDAYAQTAQAGDVAEAVMVLVQRELGTDPIDDNWNDISMLSGDLVIHNRAVRTANSDAGDTSIALAAYLNLISDNPEKFSANPFTNALNNAFFGS